MSNRKPATVHPVRTLYTVGFILLVIGALLGILGVFAPPFSGTLFFVFSGGIALLLGGIAIIMYYAVLAVLTPLPRADRVEVEEDVVDPSNP